MTNRAAPACNESVDSTPLESARLQVAGLTGNFENQCTQNKHQIALSALLITSGGADGRDKVWSDLYRVRGYRRCDCVYTKRWNVCRRSACLLRNEGTACRTTDRKGRDRVRSRGFSQRAGRKVSASRARAADAVAAARYA